VTAGPHYDPDDDKDLLEKMKGPLADKAYIRSNIESMLKFCVPFIEQYQQQLSITEASMSLRALQFIKLVSPKLATDIFYNLENRFINAQVMELY
jgi:hypothetical protein